MLKAIRYPLDLPIVAHKDAIITAIQDHQVVIIAGETGSGKTTQLPKMCLEAGRGREKLIGCTQPRRIAAIAVAERVAEELGAAGSGMVGYKIRFREQIGPATRVKFMTDGILLAETQRDRSLRTYDTIIVDEAHERSLNIDFLLGLLKKLLNKRKDLKVIITSATIDTEKFSRSFGGAPVISVSGRTYPVEVRYEPVDAEAEEREDITYIDQAVSAVVELRNNDPRGDILVFMPTERDIHETVDTMQKAIARQNKRNKQATAGQGAVILPLFGRLSPVDQSRIFKPQQVQKIVVATNVAETSITVPGIRYVVDTGLARMSMYNARARTHKLPILPVAKASCDQRQGRCGRVGPGVCVRLYPEDDYLNRPEYTLPEIQRANLAEVILRMLSLRLGEPQRFPFIDPPSPRAIKDGYALLVELGAIDQQRRLTDRGRLMARLPLDPRIARMVIEARDHNALREVTVIAAALSIQDPRIRPAEKEAEADAAHAPFAEAGSDFLAFLKIWDTYHNTFEKIQSLSRMRKFCRQHYLSFQRMREWFDIHEQICSILAEEGDFLPNTVPAEQSAIHRAILSGNLRNIAMKKMKNIFQGAGGREVMIFPGSGQFNRAGVWIMAAELVETSKLYARTVATIEPEWIEPLARDLCRSSYSDPHWEKSRGQVVAFEKVTLFGLVIVGRRRINFGRVNPAEARQIFIQQALVDGELRGEYEFLDHNRKLVASLQDVEDRVRRRDILVDEHALFLFYDGRLPADVRDQKSLNRFLKGQRSQKHLKMRQEDILRQSPADEQLQRFPKTLSAGGVDLELSYRFEPGAEDDGVSVNLPLNLLSLFSADFFDWLVPGLLLDKIVFLLKGLPKALRRELIPVPQTAAELLEDLKPYAGSLYGALERAIQSRFGITVERRHWPIAALPDHLRMRFRLVDIHGNVLKTSRALAEFGNTRQEASGLDGRLDNLKKQWEQEVCSPAVLTAAAEQIPIRDKNGALVGFACPALREEADGSVWIRLYVDAEKSREVTRAGLLALYLQHFKPQLKGVKKDLIVPRSHWALHEGIDSHQKINEDLRFFILEEIFGTRGGEIPSESEFSRRIDMVREKGLYRLGRQYYDLVMELLRERRAALDTVHKFAGMIGAGGLESAPYRAYLKAVDRILPDEFLRNFDLTQLHDAGRYLKALQIRVERAYASPAKDSAKAAQVAPHEEQLAQCMQHGSGSPEKMRLLKEYRHMIEEFKVSLFAQEIKTAFPVSEKRLKRKWQELKAQC